MARFLIESKHTPEECLGALDALSAHGETFLERFNFACAEDDHRSWAFVEAEDEAAARDMMPAILRDRARIVEVERYTPEEIREMHRPQPTA